MAWAYNILEEGLGKVNLVKLIEDNSILSPEVDIIKLDVPIEVGEGFSVELTNSGPWISRSIRLPVGGSTLTSPRDFLRESRHNRVSMHNLANIGDSSVDSIVSKLILVELEISKRAMTQKQRGGSLVSDFVFSAFVARVAALAFGS